MSRSIRRIRSIRSSDAALDKSLVPKRQQFLSIGSHRWMAMKMRCIGSCGTEGAGLRGGGEGAGGGESGGGGGVAALPLAQTTLSHSPEQHQTPSLLLRFATRCDVSHQFHQMRIDSLTDQLSSEESKINNHYRYGLSLLNPSKRSF